MSVYGPLTRLYCLRRPGLVRGSEHNAQQPLHEVEIRFRLAGCDQVIYLTFL